jgi:hypothetical protein
LCLYMFVCIFFLGTEVSSEATTIEPGWAEQCNLDACMSRFFIACVYFFFKIIVCVYIYYLLCSCTHTIYFQQLEVFKRKCGPISIYKW